MKRILPLMLAFTLVGCLQEKLPNNPLEHFKNVKQVKVSRKVDLAEFDILKTFKVVSYKDWYVFTNINHGKGCVKFVSKDFARSFDGLNYGNGPYEVNGWYDVLAVGDKVFVPDPNHKRMISLEYNDSLIVSYVSESCTFDKITPISSERFITMVNFKDSSFLSVEDLYDNVYSNIGFPSDKTLDGMPWGHKMQVFRNSTVIVDPSQNKFAWAVSSVSSFGFGVFKGDSMVVEKSFEYQPADIYISNGDFKYNKTAVNAVQSGVATDQYAIFLWSGKLREKLDFTGKDLLFYYWNGEPCMRVRLELPMVSVSYDKNRNVVYGISNDPEPVLVEYDMTGIID